MTVTALLRSEAVRDLAASALWMSGLSAPPRIGANRLTIFTIHRVLPLEFVAAYPFPELCITPQQLEQCVGFAARHFDVGPLTAQLHRFRRYEATGKPLLALTFDDGQWDNHHFAVPILEKHGVLATFYVPVEHVDTRQLIWHDRLGFSGLDHAEEVFARFGLAQEGKFSLAQMCERAKELPAPVRMQMIGELERKGAAAPSWSRMMSWQEIRELAAKGHEIGSHSMSHALLPQLGDAEQEWELLESHRRLVAETGAAVDSFCYPNGSHDDRALQLLRKGPYTNAVSTRMGLHANRDDDYMIRRIHIDARCFSKAPGESGKRLALQAFLASRK